MSGNLAVAAPTATDLFTAQRILAQVRDCPGGRARHADPALCQRGIHLPDVLATLQHRWWRTPSGSVLHADAGCSRLRNKTAGQVSVAWAQARPMICPRCGVVPDDVAKTGTELRALAAQVKTVRGADAVNGKPDRRVSAQVEAAYRKLAATRWGPATTKLAGAAKTVAAGVLTRARDDWAPERLDGTLVAQIAARMLALRDDPQAAVFDRPRTDADGQLLAASHHGAIVTLWTQWCEAVTRGQLAPCADDLGIRTARDAWPGHAEAARAVVAGWNAKLADALADDRPQVLVALNADSAHQDRENGALLARITEHSVYSLTQPPRGAYGLWVLVPVPQLVADWLVRTVHQVAHAGPWRDGVPARLVTDAVACWDGTEWGGLRRAVEFTLELHAGT